MKLDGKRLVNLTGRSVVLLDGNDVIDIVVDAGAPARFNERLIRHGINGDGISFIEVTEEPTGIPEPEDRTLYIVNKPVALAMAVGGIAREDVVIAHDVQRDHQGRYTGARGLAHLI